MLYGFMFTVYTVNNIPTVAVSRNPLRCVFTSHFSLQSEAMSVCGWWSELLDPERKMSSTAIIADLFELKPQQWGLRGDPFLWCEMAQHFCDTPFPSSPVQLTAALEEAFQLLTTKSILFSGSIHIPMMNHGGMSSGHISTEFWRCKAIPLLLSRFKALKLRLLIDPTS